MVNEMPHYVVRQRTVPRFRASLCIDLILCGGQLMEKVKCFNSEYQFAFHEWLRERSIQYKIIGVHWHQHSSAKSNSGFCQDGMRCQIALSSRKRRRHSSVCKYVLLIVDRKWLIAPHHDDGNFHWHRYATGWISYRFFVYSLHKYGWLTGLSVRDYPI